LASPLFKSALDSLHRAFIQSKERLDWDPKMSRVGWNCAQLNATAEDDCLWMGGNQLPPALLLFSAEAKVECLEDGPVARSRPQDERVTPTSEGSDVLDCRQAGQDVTT
jgi:hypothetical protein